MRRILHCSNELVPGGHVCSTLLALLLLGCVVCPYVVVNKYGKAFCTPSLELFQSAYKSQAFHNVFALGTTFIIAHACV